MSSPTYTNGNGPSLFYVATDCGDIAATCVGGQDIGGGTPNEFTVDWVKNETVFIIVDRLGRNEVSDSTLKVEGPSL